MLNLTLTITAAPELLAAMKGFTNAITAAKVVTIPEYNSNFTDHKSSDGQEIASYNQPNIVPVNNPVTSSIDYGVQAGQQAAIKVPQVQVAPVPTSTQSYTMEQLAVAATQLMDAGRRAELVSLLSSFGVQALTALPKEQYGAFATQLRTLGAKI